MKQMFRLFPAMLLVGALAMSACKKDFDNPPVATDPAIVANTTIAGLKAKHTTAGAYDIITTDVIISGTVTADDRSGNLYKQFYMQDSTGGLQVQIDMQNIFSRFPVGRKVYIKAKGLCISDYNGTMQLGVKATINNAPSFEAIPTALISNHVIGGTLNNPVVPIEVTVAQLQTGMNSRYIGSLILLKNYEIRAQDTALTWSDTSVYKTTTNMPITLGCGGSSATVVRTSAYANFAGVSVPNGNGDITAIYTVFGSTKQLIIRDTSDVKFNGLRCGVAAGTQLLNENFEAYATTTSLAIPGWVNAAEQGTRLWGIATFSSNKYANLSAFGSAMPVVKTWLVTKPVNLAGYASKILSFRTNQGFIGTGGITAAALKVLVSTNYTGSATPWTATWTDITASAALSPGGATGFPADFTNSGNISLNAYSGTLYVAFVYDGGITANKTSTWEVDDVVVTVN